MAIEGIQASDVKITDHMISSVRSTKPWTRFLSVLGFICVAFTFLGGILMMFAGKIFPQTGGRFPSIMMGIMYVIMSIVYLFPSIYLFKYSSAVAHFLLSGKVVEMESALSYQKSFWKFVGILMIISLAFAIVGIIAAIVIPLVAGIQTRQAI